jgi:ABC-2 type transport system ATP-binding protein
MQAEIILSVKDLHKSYGSFKAVDNLGFDVFKGDVFGFLGPNGAGKSTTIRMMLSLITADSGEINVFGRSLARDRNYILKRIGCIVEKPDFYKFLSAEKNLEVFAKLSGASIPKNRIEELLEFVGLKGRGKDKVKGFSHGMKQRLGIAQTLIHDPDLIILDEPTTGLDPQGILDVRNLITQLRSEKNKTVILSSHILSEIEIIATRVVIINKGRSIVQGNVDDLLGAEEMVVAIRTDNAQKAQAILEPKVKEVHLVKDELIVSVRREDIPAVNRALCDQGIGVFSIEPRRKLEDYFLKLVTGEADQKILQNTNTH